MTIDKAELLRMLRARRRGYGLPGAFYNDPAVYALDLDAIFTRHWLCVGAACEIPLPGDYVTIPIGTTSVIVLRDQDSGIRAFFNTCRHRGARICDADRGHIRTLVCPYHRWTYKLSGALAYAPYMPDDFDRGAHGLRQVPVRTLCGAIYICLADDPPDFDRYADAMAPLLAPHRLQDAKLAASIDLIENANWKLAMENSRECYHCATQHRELMRTFLDLYDMADPGQSADIRAFWERCERDGVPSHIAEGPDFRASRLPFTHGARSITMDGEPAVARLLGDVPHNDIGSLRWVHYPTTFNHALGDYAVMVRMLPIGPQQTLVTTKFLVNSEAEEGKDYDLDRLTHVWTVTNEQDKALVERNQAGVNSIGYVPGPYAPAVEAGVIKFVDWYCDKLTRHLHGGSATQAAA
jgi:Rieske 2Fe-2S family protein